MKETLAAIVMEDEDTKRQRVSLDQKIADLRKAHEDCLGIVVKNTPKTVREPLVLCSVTLKMKSLLT